MPNYPTGRIFPAYRGKWMHSEMMDEIRVFRLWLLPSHSRNLLARGISMASQVASLFRYGKNILRKLNPDLVIVSSPPLLNAYAAMRIAANTGAKLVLNVSDIWPLTAAAMGALSAGPAYHLLQKTERAMYEKASAFMGQSDEILQHIQRVAPHGKPKFLYRNLQPQSVLHFPEISSNKIIYAGLLGHAQGVLALCRSVDFKRANAELHIRGNGAEEDGIRNYIAAHPGCNIFLHPVVPPDELMRLLPDFKAMLVPLRTMLEGAVPSKLFTAVGAGLPVLYSAGGEGEKLVQEHQLGFINAPGDYASLQENIVRLLALNDAGYQSLRQNVQRAAATVFNKQSQDAAFLSFLKSIG